MSGLIVVNDKGMYCPEGDFYVDPWSPVSTAIISHAHSDHLRSGHAIYHTNQRGKMLVSHRIRQETPYELISHEFDEPFDINGVTVTLHPAGHILGSAQVRIEKNGQVWVISGDYKRKDDPTCRPFEPVPCDTFLTEATFGKPLYRWYDPHFVVEQIYKWWQRNASENKPSVLFCYSLGKAQRILAHLTRYTNKAIYYHGAHHQLTEIYRSQGIDMIPTNLVNNQIDQKSYTEDLILAPPSAFRSKWMRRFPSCETAFASGWMRVRGRRRMAGYDTGFILSDHADWPGLVKSIRQTDAQQVQVAYNQAPVLVRYLRDELDINTIQLSTRYSGEDD